MSSTETPARLSDVLAGLSAALDLTEGQRPGHSVRRRAIGMRIASVLDLSPDQRSALFYALLMKDLGCSSNAARFPALFAADDRALKPNLTLVDWPHALQSFRFVARNVAPGHFWLRRVWQALAVFARGPGGARDVVLTRCERGADIAGMLGFCHDTVQAIRALDEHWDGRGQPYNFKGTEIPLLARILCLAQTAEIFFSSYGEVVAYDVASRRRGSWFDPDVVDAFQSIRGDRDFWRWLREGDVASDIGSAEPPDQVFVADENRLDVVAEAFALVIDAKSPWTYKHSKGVADLTVGLAGTLGFSADETRQLRRAALLHDLGKLGVSNPILDKPAKLADTEFDVMRRHPAHTESILRRIGCFSHLADLAGSHHERLDGKGYHRGEVRPQMLTNNPCFAAACALLVAAASPVAAQSPAPPGPLENLSFFVGPDGSKQPQDLGINANMGTRFGVNFGGPLSDSWKLGFQGGAAQNFSDAAVHVLDQVEGTSRRTQTFVTMGVFQRPTPALNWGLVYDFSHSRYYDEFNLGQVRGQVGFGLRDEDEVGVRFAKSVQGDEGSMAGTPVRLHPITQVTGYHRHTWATAAQTSVWAGVANGHHNVVWVFDDNSRDRNVLVYGAELSMPLSERFSISGAANLVTPTATGTMDAYLGVTFHPGRSGFRAVRNTFSPIMPVANNPEMAINLSR